MSVVGESRPTKGLLRECENELVTATKLEPFSVRKFNEAARFYLLQFDRYQEWAKDKSPRSQYEMPYRIRKILGM